MEIAPPQSSEVSVFTAALNPIERDILGSLLNRTGPVEEIVPADTDAETVWQYLTVASKALMRTRELTAQLKPLIGRLLVLVKQYPQLYQGQDGMDQESGEVKQMRTFEDFLAYGLPAAIGISRAEAYAAQKIAVCFPNLDLSTYSAIGNMKMKALTRLPFGANGEPPRDIAQWVQTAADPKVSVDVFQAMVAGRSMLDPGDMKMVSVVINMTATERDAWRSFRGNKRYHRLCGTSAEGTLLQRAIIEAASTWEGEIAINAVESGL
jgi:hypothetical protein